MNNNHTCALFLAGILSAFPFIHSQAQGISKVACFDQSGHPVECGDTWYPVKDGVTYKCVCNCNGADQCTPLSSSSSSSTNSYNSGSNDIRMTVATAVVGGLFNALNKWINSPSSNNTSSSAQSNAPAPRELTEAEKAEIERKQAEYRQHVLDQVNKASAEYSAQMNQDFSQKQQSTLNDLKTKFVRSESVKSIKQLNCAAYNSILAAKENCKLDFNNLDGSMEHARSMADFASGVVSDCPEITYNILDVTPTQPIGFQQVYYETIKSKSDSINTHVTMLKESNKVIQKSIEEKKQVVEKLKSDNQTQGNNDQLLQEAMKALNESREEQESITEEIKASEKNIEIYDMMRSAYDVNKTEEISKIKKTN
jgi:hypothetical protein